MNCKHPRLVKGLGMLSDAVLCLDCGLETYNEFCSEAELSRAVNVDPQIWDDIATARALPSWPQGL